jgi:predicted Zn-dependent protease
MLFYLRPFWPRRLGWLALLLWTWVAGAHGPWHEQILLVTEKLAQKPRDPELLAQRAELFLAHGFVDESRQDLVALETLQPGNLTNQLRRGWLELKARKTNAAIEQLTAWVKARPENLEGHFGLAQAYLLAGQPGAAETHLSRVLALSDEPRPELFLERAQAQVAAGLALTNTLAGLDEGIARLGPLPLLQKFAADLEMKRGEVAAAVARIQTIAARSERQERWLFLQGELFRQAGRTNDACGRYLAARSAWQALPDKLRRSYVATELRQQIDARLAEFTAASDR